MDYQKGDYVLTPFTQVWSQNRLKIQIGPRCGDQSLTPTNRTFRLEIYYVQHPDQIICDLNGKPNPIEYAYDSREKKLTLSPFCLEPKHAITVQLNSTQGSLLAYPDTTIQKLRRYLHLFRLDSDLKEQIELDWPAIVSGTYPLYSYRKLSASQISALQSLLE